MTALNTLTAAVEEFMEKAGQLEGTPYLSPSASDDVRRARRAWLAGVKGGEVGEYLDAEFENNPVEIADGLLDIIFVAYGTLISYFGPAATEQMANEIARSNLSKVGPGMIKGADGKIQKSPEYSAPDLRPILEANGFDFTDFGG